MGFKQERSEILENGGQGLYIGPIIIENIPKGGGYFILAKRG